MDKAEVYLEAAAKWYQFGLKVIPVVPGGKATSVKWDSWLEDLSLGAITIHWTMNPDHEVGFIVGDEILVLDADTPEAVTVLTTLEWEHGVAPNLVVKTKKGEHHYFRLTEGTYAKTTGHGSERPDQMIDVKTGRTMVILPPSTGKSIFVNEAEDVGDLVEATQAFIDAVHIHKGQLIPRPPAKLSAPKLISEPSTESVAEIEALLNYIDPDLGYEEWTRVVMAIYHETGGSDEGLDLADQWSSRGRKYKGRREIEAKWRSFREVPNPVTKATLIKMAKDNGADVEVVIEASAPQFEVCETIVVDNRSSVTSTEAPVLKTNPLVRFSLTGQSEELEREAVDRVPLLGQIAVLGQSTIIYAAPNTGKTLVTLKQLTESIEAERVNGSDVFYLNMDDDSKGLVEKLKLAEEFGFNMLAEGYNGFSAKTFLKEIQNLIVHDQANGVVIILDTLKKFVDLMLKGACRDYNLVLGAFVAKGGTVVALAHTNKNSGQDGTPVHAGTTDMLEDFSCAFTIRELTERGARDKAILFEKLKGRGGVVNKACYSYVTGKDISYNEMFLSVREVDERQIAALEQANELHSDAEVIDAVIACINEGVNTKMLLAEAAAKRSGASKRSVLKLIEKYTGDDPAQHRWFFARGERGKQTFSVLDGRPE